MYSPTTRLLTLLELLQSQSSVSGAEAAELLEVEVRSIRRYITMLRDMGIPVESEKGRYGSYSLRPGFRLPPLMFTDTEIVALTLGLKAVRHLGLTLAPGVESAGRKIERVLPDELRHRVRAVQESLTLNLSTYATVGAETLAQFSVATYQHYRLWIRYQAVEGKPTEREIDVYGLVFTGGAWYAVAYCHLRESLRVFRLDRVQQVHVLEDYFEPPADFDALDYLLTSFAKAPGFWRIEVLLKTTLEYARDRVPGDMALLEETPDGVLLTCYSDGLDWIGRFLIRLACPFTVLEPPDLRDHLRKIAESIIDMSAEPAPAKGDISPVPR